MNVEGLKKLVAEEMVQKFREWLDDYTKMSDREYGRKYGWGRTDKQYTFNKESFMVFHKYFFNGRYIQGWLKAGYTPESIYALHLEKFLSYKYYSNWSAKQTGHSEWYYISKRTAGQIWKMVNVTV